MSKIGWAYTEFLQKKMVFFLQKKKQKNVFFPGDTKFKCKSVLQWPNVMLT